MHFSDLVKNKVQNNLSPFASGPQCLPKAVYIVTILWLICSALPAGSNPGRGETEQRILEQPNTPIPSNAARFCKLSLTRLVRPSCPVLLRPWCHIETRGSCLNGRTVISNRLPGNWYARKSSSSLCIRASQKQFSAVDIKRCQFWFKYCITSKDLSASKPVLTPPRE